MSTERADEEEAEHLIRQIFLLSSSSSRASWRDVLPHPTSSEAVNLQLLAFIGCICRQFVLSWHSKISEDPEFMTAVMHTVSAVIRMLEARARKVDVTDAVLNSLPAILESHIEDLRKARERFGTGLMPVDTVEEAFHCLRPHPALDSAESEQLVRKVLAKAVMLVLLEEDNNIKSAASRTLVSTVINDIILKIGIERLSEPWMIYEIIIKVTELIPKPKEEEPRMPKLKNETMAKQLGEYYDRLVKFTGSAIAFGGRAVAYIVSLQQQPSPPHSRPVVLSAVFSCISTLYKLHYKSPLLVSTVNTLSIPFRSGRLEDLSAKAAARLVSQYVASEKMVLIILKNARRTVFPSGYMGPPRIIPNEEEAERIRVRARDAIVNSTPAKLRPVLFGTGRAAMDQSVDEMLGLFANKKINKHLVYNVIDYALVTLIPELAEISPSDMQQSTKLQEPINISEQEKNSAVETHITTTTHHPRKRPREDSPRY